MNATVLQGDCIEQMRTLPDASVHCCVTSPPYYGLRDYGHAGQIGLEETPDAYVAKLVAVFREVRRVLRDDGTLWLNLGDSYASSTSGNGGYSDKSTLAGFTSPNTKGRRANETGLRQPLRHGLKPKDLIGIPWRVAFALQADGWWLRQDIIWHKPNPMPESVRDRCTKAHEYLFLLSKSARYHFDAEAIAENAANEWRATDMLSKSRGKNDEMADENPDLYRTRGRGTYHSDAVRDTRNKRSVWTVATKPYAEAHFATFPPKLIEPMILAGCPAGGTVLDPFGGSGTTAAVATEHGRNAIICELNPSYVELARRRIGSVQPRLIT